jgi:hypothetical protein
LGENQQGEDERGEEPKETLYTYDHSASDHELLLQEIEPRTILPLAIHPIQLELTPHQPTRLSVQVRHTASSPDVYGLHLRIQSQ